jgi:predicted ester cyclase
MSVEENKAIARRVIEEVHNQGNFAVWDSLIAPSYVNHNLPPGQSARERQQMITMYRAALPGQLTTIDDLIAEGDEVVVRWTQHAVHAGPLPTPFGNIPPTGKQITVTGMIIFRIVDGKITDEWENWDTLGMLQQLGVVPSAE